MYTFYYSMNGEKHLFTYKFYFSLNDLKSFHLDLGGAAKLENYSFPPKKMQ